MTTNHKHTPTATQIREDYAHLRYHFADGWSIGEERVQFDNWLAAEIAAAEQRGAIKALREARQAWYDHADQMTDMPSKYYPAVWLRNLADRIADQEGDGGRN